MRTYKYSYNVEKVADNKSFLRACEEIERQGIEGLQKKRLLVDVDGSLIQIYIVPNGEIKVMNDYEVDAVYIDSDVDLSAMFTPAPFSN